MGRQALPIVSPKGPYPGVVAANGLDFVLTACDVTNFDEFVFTGRELLIVQNSGASTYTFTLESVADPQGRTGDITAYSLAAGLFSIFWFGQKTGWEQAGGKLYLKASNVAVKFAVVRIPG